MPSSVLCIACIVTKSFSSKVTTIELLIIPSIIYMSVDVYVCMNICVNKLLKIKFYISRSYYTLHILFFYLIIYQQSFLKLIFHSCILHNWVNSQISRICYCGYDWLCFYCLCLRVIRREVSYKHHLFHDIFAVEHYPQNNGENSYVICLYSRT